MKLRLLLLFLYIMTHQWAYGWGYTAHRLINREAVNLLNFPLGEFFSGHINYISEHAVDPDLWKIDKENHPNESPGHFIDADLFDDHPFKKIPRKWEDVVNKYGEKKLDSWGTAPWRIEEYYYRLVRQFRDGEWIKARLTAAALGHYVSDIHVPFHTCENYNGQLTGNKGVHKR
ncbi:MAG TPA: S1/P1 Nuclease, partial [Candidatus Marinimicrobia bacterium]|nr:S1/P1 Nuclease [Candidatus Neomarinimicrobiota bacterium]